MAATPARAEPAPSLYGINTGTYDDDYGHFLRDVPTARSIGAKWVEFSGANIKFPRGRLDFGQMDRQVNRARSQGLGVMALGGIEGACSVRPRPSDVTTCPPTTKKDLRVYTAYLRRLLGHFRGRVHYYESWLEPNHASFWPRRPNAAAYARLLAAEYRVFRSTARHRNKLIFAGIGGPDFPYLRGVLRALKQRRAFDVPRFRIPIRRSSATTACCTTTSRPTPRRASSPASPTAGDKRTRTLWRVARKVYSRHDVAVAELARHAAQIHHGRGRRLPSIS